MDVLNHRTKSASSTASNIATNSPAQQFAYAAATAANAGDFALAQSNAARVTELEPSFAEAWVAYGMASVRLGQVEQAKVAYERGLALHQARHRNDPEDANQVLQQIFVLSLLGRSDEAQALLKQAQTEYPYDEQLALLSKSFAETEKSRAVWTIKAK